MKNYPLAMQIWLVFASIMLCITILLTVLFPWTLRDFFTREIYATIENTQSLVFNQQTWETGFPQEQRQQMHNIRTVNHFLILPEGQVMTHPRLPNEFLKNLTKEVQAQKYDSQRYVAQVDDRKIFYVITKGKVSGHDVFLVSYMWDTYRDDLVQTLFNRLLLIMGLVFVLSWIPSLLLARFLSKPLVNLEQRVKSIANRHWHQPVQIDRQDEIGQLGQSIEQLRKQLIQHDEAQQSFLQHISHELKTPVMVIRSYTQAVKDGVYPKGDLASTVQVIDEETEQLERRIRNLLYLTKLDYIETNKPSHQNLETFDLSQLIREVIDRLRWCRSDLDWSLKMNSAEIEGNIEQWQVVIENLLDNQIRYAVEQVSISLYLQTNGQYLLHIWNDGPPIEQDLMTTMFEKFNKGYKGKFGLGLAVVQRIAALHHAKISVKNENQGVSFYLEIPN